MSSRPNKKQKNNLAHGRTDDAPEVIEEAQVDTNGPTPPVEVSDILDEEEITMEDVEKKLGGLETTLKRKIEEVRDNDLRVILLKLDHVLDKRIGYVSQRVGEVSSRVERLYDLLLRGCPPFDMVFNAGSKGLKSYQDLCGMASTSYAWLKHAERNGQVASLPKFGGK